MHNRGAIEDFLSVKPPEIPDISKWKYHKDNQCLRFSCKFMATDKENNHKAFCSKNGKV